MSSSLHAHSKLEALPILGLGALSILLQAIPAWGGWATLDLDAAGLGHYAQLITCHFAHWSWNHLLWSGGTFVFMALLAWRLSSLRTVLGLTLLSALTVGGGVLLTRPDLYAYNGLSGLDCALFAFVAIALLSRAWEKRDWYRVAISIFAIIGLGAKVAMELSGQTFFVSTPGLVVVPEAHLVGMLTGIGFGLHRLFSTYPLTNRSPDPQTAS